MGIFRPFFFNLAEPPEKAKKQIKRDYFPSELISMYLVGAQF